MQSGVAGQPLPRAIVVSADRTDDDRYALAAAPCGTALPIKKISRGVCRCFLSRHTPDCTRRLRQRKTARTGSAAARAGENGWQMRTSERDRPGAASPEPARRGRQALKGTETSREALAAGGLGDSQARSLGGAGGVSDEALKARDDDRFIPTAHPAPGRRGARRRC